MGKQNGGEDVLQLASRLVHRASVIEQVWEENVSHEFLRLIKE